MLDCDLQTNQVDDPTTPRTDDEMILIEDWLM